MNGLISSNDISIVVQGAVTIDTARVLQSLRHTLPMAFIILSTWHGTDVGGLSYDELVLSDDPGAMLQNRKLNIFNNVNRQIVSTETGLALSTRPYTLKTRTDILIESAEFLDFFDKYDGQNPAAIFNKRILVCDYYSRNPRAYSTPYHPSDWLSFGMTEDLKAYFDIPLMGEEDAFWFDSHKRTSWLFRDNICRYFPEQWLCLSLLRKNEYIDCDCFYDNAHGNIERTERFFAENMVIVDLPQWGLGFTKYNPNRYGDDGSLLHFADWYQLYQHYCNANAESNWASYQILNSFRHIKYSYFRPIAALFLGKLGIKRWIQRKLNGTVSISDANTKQEPDIKQDTTILK